MHIFIIVVLFIGHFSSTGFIHLTKTSVTMTVSTIKTIRKRLNFYKCRNVANRIDKQRHVRVT